MTTVEVITDKTYVVEVNGNFPGSGSGSMTYVTDIQPNAVNQGDQWFNSTTKTVQYNVAGSWTSPVLDAGQF